MATREYVGVVRVKIEADDDDEATVKLASTGEWSDWDVHGKWAHIEHDMAGSAVTRA